jgi:hypothetical protein
MTKKYNSSDVALILVTNRQYIGDIYFEEMNKLALIRYVKIHLKRGLIARPMDILAPGTRRAWFFSGDLPLLARKNRSEAEPEVARPGLQNKARNEP